MILIKCLLVLLSFLQTEKIEMTIKLPHKKCEKRNDLNLDIRFTNVGRNTQLVPRHPNFSTKEENSDSGNWIIWELEKKSSSGNVKIMGIEHYNMPDVLPPEDRYDTLSMNKSINRKYPLNAIYTFSPGEYKVRGSMKFKNLNGETHEVYSNWVYFEVTKNYSLLKD